MQDDSFILKNVLFLNTNFHKKIKGRKNFQKIIFTNFCEHPGRLAQYSEVSTFTPTITFFPFVGFSQKISSPFLFCFNRWRT